MNENRMMITVGRKLPKTKARTAEMLRSVDALASIRLEYMPIRQTDPKRKN